MISKELLSEILNYPVKAILPSYFSNTIGFIFEGETEIKYPNKYELNHKCKEFAWAKFGAVIKTQIASLDNPLLSPTPKVELEYWDGDTPKSRFFKTEFEAIDWLLRNIK